MSSRLTDNSIYFNYLRNFSIAQNHSKTQNSTSGKSLRYFYCEFFTLQVAMLFFTSKFSCFIQNFLHHRLAVNKIIKISPEPIKIQSLKDDRLIDIQMPSSHFKTLPIPCRLLSATKRRGMVGEDSQQEMSKHLILHAHGGVSTCDYDYNLDNFYYRL